MNMYSEMTDAAEAAARTVEHVQADQLAGPTPCTEWDVRTLLNHLIVWTSYSLEARAHGGSVSQELIDRDFAADPGFAAAYRAQLDRALTAWSDPATWDRSLDVMGSPMPSADVAALNIAEMVLHGWDLAAATGQAYAVSDRPRPWRCAPPRPTPTSSASTRGSPSRSRCRRRRRRSTACWRCPAATRPGRRRLERSARRAPPGLPAIVGRMPNATPAVVADLTPEGPLRARST